MAYLVTKISVSSYLAFPSLPQVGYPKAIKAYAKPLAAVYFCCTFPKVALA